MSTSRLSTPLLSKPRYALVPTWPAPLALLSLLSVSMSAAGLCADEPKPGGRREAAAQTAGKTPGKPAEKTERPAPPKIVSEPKTIDPAAVLPKALSKRVTVRFSDSSLQEVVKWLREEQKLAVLLDTRALSGSGISIAEPVTDRLDNAPIYLLLNRLRSLGVAWFLEDDVLHLTSTKESERLTTLPHTVREVLQLGVNREALTQVVIDTIDPESWDFNGGDGSLSFLGNVLFVRQTLWRQYELDGLFHALVKPAEQTFAFDPVEHVRLRELLQRKVKLSATDQPLEAVVEQLAKQTGADIRLDMTALKKRGIRPRQAISMSLEDRPLRTVLEAIGIDFKLTWTLRDGVLWITGIDDAAANVKTAVYDVRDLCVDFSESEALSEALGEQAADEWLDDEGGSGRIVFAQPGTMVVRTNEAMHAEVLRLLRAYRKALASFRPEEAEPVDLDEVMTLYYRVDHDVANDLMTLLPKFVEPKSWKTPKNRSAVGEILIVASEPKVERAKNGTPLVLKRSVLIITQTRRAQKEVHNVIQRVTDGYYDDLFLGSAGGGGLGGGGLGGGMGGGGFGGGFGGGGLGGGR